MTHFSRLFFREYHYYSTLLMIFFAFLSLNFGATILATELDNQEKRSCIQEVDGYAYLSEDQTLSQLRISALNNAKKQALANAKTYIKSHTLVENFVLKKDEVQVNAEGTVTILEQKDFGIHDNSRYHMWIKAEVEYVLFPQGSVHPAAIAPPIEPVRTGEASDMPNLPSSQAPLTVKVWSPRKEYVHGQHIEVFIKGNKDFYARIVDINSSGDIVQLLPNESRSSSFFKGGTVYTIPGENDQFDLQVSKPYGEDRIVVYASEVPLGGVALTGIGQGLGAYDGDQESLGLATRSISVVHHKDEPSSVPIASFYEASYTITTLEKSSSGNEK